MSSKFRSIRWELCLAVGIPLVAVYLTVLGTAYYEFRKHAYEGMSNYMTARATLYAEKFNEAFSVTAQGVNTTASFLEEKTVFSEETLYHLLRDHVSQNPFISGSAIAFAENAFTSKKKLFGPYVCRKTPEMNAKQENPSSPKNTELFREIDVAKDAYDYRSWDWYSSPKKSGVAVWTEPFFDEGAGNIMMCTYSTPFFKNGKFQGVVTADIPIQNLQKFLREDSLVASNAFVIISREGQYITHPNPEYIMKETIFSNAEKIHRPELISLGRKMTSGGKGAVLIKDFTGSKKIFLFYAPITSTGWSFAATVPEEEIMRPVWQQLTRFGLSMSVGLLLIVILLLVISAKIPQPAIKLSAAAKKLGTGDFDVPFEESYGANEIGALAESFKQMVQGLKKYMAALTQEIAKRQQVESELQVARDIQLSLLPKTFPPFPERKEFDLYGKNGPARFVAGDFFDFFFVNGNTLVFTIADVSGKGIPAAMFMVIARTLIRNITSSGKSPSETLEATNKILFDGNERGMFVTLFLGYYDLRSGTVWYVNAGHHQPYCIDRSGKVRKFGRVTGTILGISEDLKYEAAKETLALGETLILYTDGFPEARTPSGEFLNEKRFQAFLEGHAQESVMALCEKVFQEAMDFQQQKPTDDLTILSLRRLI